MDFDSMPAMSIPTVAQAARIEVWNDLTVNKYITPQKKISKINF